MSATQNLFKQIQQAGAGASPDPMAGQRQSATTRLLQSYGLGERSFQPMEGLPTPTRQPIAPGGMSFPTPATPQVGTTGGMTKIDGTVAGGMSLPLTQQQKLDEKSGFDLNWNNLFNSITDTVLNTFETAKSSIINQWQKENQLIRDLNIDPKTMSTDQVVGALSVPLLNKTKHEFDRRLSRISDNSPYADFRRNNLQKTLDKIDEIIAMPPEQRAKEAMFISGLALDRLGHGFFSSIIGFGANTVSHFTWLSDKFLAGGKDRSELGIHTEAIANRLNEWSENLRPENPEFADHLVSGLGSVIPYYMTGMGAGTLASGLAKVSPRVAKLLTVTSGTYVMGTTQAGMVYDINLKQGWKVPEAQKTADNVFLGNVAVGMLMNRYGLFNDRAGMVGALQAGAFEGLQEMWQEGLVNVNTGRPFNEGLSEAGLYGALIGFIVKGAGLQGMVRNDINSADMRKLQQIDKDLSAGKFDTEMVMEDIGTDLTEIVSKSASNSLQNDPNGIKQQTVDYLNNTQTTDLVLEPIEIRRTPEGEIVIVDGRHRLEMARQTGFPVQIRDVSYRFDHNYDGNLITEFKTQIEADPTLVRKTYEYDSTQLDIQGDQRSDLVAFTDSIARQDLDFMRGGREANPHITALFGIAEGNLDTVSRIVNESAPIEVELGKTDVFKQDGYDVLYVSVKSDQLTQLHNKLDQALDTPGKTQESFTPHVTLAYLKPGKSDVYVNNNRFEGRKLTLDNLTLSTKDGQLHTISLRGEATVPTTPAAVRTDQTVEVLQQELRDIYSNADPEALGQAWFEVMSELDIAEAGQRLFTQDGEFSGSISSTFPNWIPPELRSRKLFDNVVEGIRDIENITYPPATHTKKQALYDEVLSRIDSIAGTDSSDVIIRLKDQYAREQEQRRTATADDRSPARRTTDAEESARRTTDAEESARESGKEPETLAFKPRNLKDLKTNHKISLNKVSEAEQKIKTRQEIISFMSEKLGVPIRKGYYNKPGAAGIFKVKSEVIRTKAGLVETEVHEVGHYLQQNIPELSKTRIEKFTGELTKVGEATGYGADKPTVEGFAEFFRLYIGDNPSSKALAPKFYKYFNDTLSKNYAEVFDVVDTIRRDYERWQTAPVEAKVMSHISFEQEGAGWMDNVKKWAEAAPRRFTDDLYPIKKFVELAQEQGIDVQDSVNPYIVARLNRGWFGKAQVFLEAGTFDPNNFYGGIKNGKAKINYTGKSFKDILSPISKQRLEKEFSAYLTTKRAIDLEADRNIVTGLIKRPGSSGITLAEAKQFISDLDAKHPEFKVAQQELLAYQDAILDYGVKRGLIDRRTRKRMRELNKNYVPFYRVFEDMMYSNRSAMGKKIADAKSNIKSIRGSERQIIDPLESIVKNTFTMIEAGERNHVGALMADLANKDKHLARLFENVSPKMQKKATVTLEDFKIDDATLAEIDDIAPGLSEQIVNVFRPAIHPVTKDGIVTFMVDGKAKMYQTDPELHASLAALDVEQANGLIRILSKPASWLRAGATLTPDFVIRNPLRDQPTAFVYSRYGYKPFWDLFKGTAELVGKTDTYRLWQVSGGSRATLVSVDRMSNHKNLESYLESRGKAAQALDYVKNPLEVFRIASDLMENSTRIGEFKLALEQDADPTTAAFASREVTQDYAKIGSYTRPVNQISAFFNATILDPQQFVHNMRTRPAEITMRGVLGLTLPTLALLAINRQDERWERIPQWQKDAFWIVFNDGFIPKMPEIIRIPKPWFIGHVFGTIPERIAEFAMNENKDLAPVLTSIESAGRQSIPGLLPTALVPLIEIQANYSFFRKGRIIPEPLRKRDPEAQYDERSSELSKLMGRVAQIPPKFIDHLINGWFAGSGNYAMQAVDQVLRSVGITESDFTVAKDLSEYPVVRAFSVRDPKGFADAKVEKFYSELERLEKGESAAKAYIEEGNQDGFYRMMERYPDMYFMLDSSTGDYYSEKRRLYSGVANLINQVNTERRKIVRNQDLTPEQKRDTIDKLDLIISELASRVIDLDFDKTVDEAFAQ